MTKIDKEKPSFNPSRLRHQLLISDIATGTTLSNAAKLRNYSVPYACKLIRSSSGQLAIASMRQDIECMLAEKLASFVGQSLEILQKELNSPLGDRRLAAATLVLKLAKPIIDSVMDGASDSLVGSVIDFKHGEPFDGTD